MCTSIRHLRKYPKEINSTTFHLAKNLIQWAISITSLLSSSEEALLARFSTRDMAQMDPCLLAAKAPPISKYALTRLEHSIVFKQLRCLRITIHRTLHLARAKAWESVKKSRDDKPQRLLPMDLPLHLRSTLTIRKRSCRIHIKISKYLLWKVVIKLWINLIRQRAAFQRGIWWSSKRKKDRETKIRTFSCLKATTTSSRTLRRRTLETFQE